jgi:MOSC domain-containing protein YiiM
MKGEVIEIHLASKSEAAMAAVTETCAVVGRGLEGDRYYEKIGAFSKKGGPGREVTLIASEAIAAYKSEHDVKLAPGEHRRNVTTRGIDVNALVGVDFRIGEAVFRGVRLCEPCEHLQRVTGIESTLIGLKGRGGLRCDVIQDGMIRVGDEIAPL